MNDDLYILFFSRPPTLLPIDPSMPSPGKHPSTGEPLVWVTSWRTARRYQVEIVFATKSGALCLCRTKQNGDWRKLRWRKRPLTPPP